MRKIIVFFCFIILFDIFSYGQKEIVDYNEIRDTLEQIFPRDQKYRLQLDSIRKLYGANSKEVDSIRNIIHEIDSCNRILVINILDNYGWPDTSQIGVTASIAIWAVIQHTPNLKIQEKYFPLLQKAVEHGLRKEFLALSTDRIATMKGKKQIYGTQIIREAKTGEPILYPIKNPKKVDKRRKEMGMFSIGKYVKKYNIEWNPAEHKKKSKKLFRRLKKDRREYLKTHKQE